MRKFSALLIVFSLLFLCGELKSQEAKIGAKAGGNYANLFGDNDKFNTAVFDFHAGGFIELSLMKKFALQGELLFSRQGTDNEGRFTLNYISLPILAKMKFFRGKLGFYIGPQVSYLLSANYDASGFEGDAADFYKKIDVAALLGGEFNLTKEISAGARFLFSIPSIGAEYDEEFPQPNGTVTNITIEAAKVRNSVLQIYVGYSF